MTEKFLDRVYGESSPEATKALYDDWASSYDAEIAENGYATPGRVAKALKSFVSDTSNPILDYGCGTGLSGLALRLVGFENIDGMDPSPDMLKLACEKDCYRSISVIDLEDTQPIPAGAYQTIAAIGVIGTGAAPASTFDLIMGALPKGGIFGFSLNDHALAESVYESALNQWLDCGNASLLFKEYGEHLPGQDLKSNVYIVEKN